MGEQVACPVCTLFLRPGIKLADHLETHPKDQVIKALVLLATAASSSTREIGITNHQNNYDESLNLLAPVRSQPPPLSPSQFFGRPILDGDTGTVLATTKGFPPTTNSRQNLMIVNRRTMFYSSSESREQSLLTSETLPIEGSSSVQIFNDGLHRHSNKSLPPPPAYRTAINQIRSQQNQSSPPYIQHTNESNLLHYNQNTIATKNHQRNNMFYQNPLDYTIGKSIPSRPSPSPSVLRYAESPVTAQYEERDNGDFLVQESPRHIVECVEKDNGDFSVIEKVVKSSPCILHINDEKKIHNNKCHKTNNNNNNSSSSSSSIIDQKKSLETTLESCRIDNDDNDDNDNDNDNEQEIDLTKENNSKKFIDGIKVLSNVKLDRNESLGLMENIMAANTTNSDNNEIIWTEIVDQSNINEINIEKKPNIIMETIKNHHENKSSSIEEEKQNDMKFIPSPSTSRKSSSSSSATSVIRMICGSKEKNYKTIPSTSQKNGDIKNRTNREQQTASHVKKTFRQVPKKLIIKKLRKSITQNNNNINNNNTSTIITTIKTDETINNDLSIPVKGTEEIEDLNIKSKIEKIVSAALATSSSSSSSIDNIKMDINNDIDVIPSKDIIDNQMTENNFMENNNNDIIFNNINNDNDNNIETKLLKIKIENTTLLPMIVHEPSLSSDEPDELQKNDNQNKLNEPKEQLRNVIDDNYTMDNSSIPINISLIDEQSGLDKSTTFTSISSSSSSSSESNIDILSNKNENIIINDDINGLSTTVTSFNSFPSTSSKFSKPSTSSSALQTDYEQQQQQQQQQSSNPNNYNDYPFSFLYDKNRLSPTFYGNNVQNENLLNNNNIDDCTNEPQTPWNRLNSQTPPIFQQYQQNLIHQNSNNHFHDIDSERNSYIDLDSCKKINTNTDGNLLQFSETLNIQTDEKMPAKGEISEQESNGDIENSWSHPLYPEPAYRISAYYENYVTSESWSYSNDELFSPQDLSSMPKLKLTPTLSTLVPEIECKKEIPTSSTCVKGKLKLKTTLNKRKTFECAHCTNIFNLMRDRNAHLIEEHGYKRVNRRLTRDALPATVTTSSVVDNAISCTIINEPNQILENNPHIDNNQSSIDNQTNGTTPLLLSSSTDDNLLSVEPMNTTITTDDIKLPTDVKVKIDTTETDPTIYSRTKYDTIRAGVYRMLMSFNLSVLQQTKNIEMDNTIFETKSFYCYTCKRDFISAKLFDEHLSEHPAECFTCGRTFTRWTYFSLHLKRHLGWKDFACTVCEKKFVIRGAMIEHMRMHTGSNPLSCKLCDKKFRRYSNLAQHKKRCHNTRLIKKKDYVCYCGEVLPSKARFLWHKETHDTRPKCCPHCRDRFVHINSLKRHIRLMHSDKFSYAQPVECPKCKQIYAKASLKAHMSTHSMETQHECSICNKSFSTKWNLKIHSWVHANRTAKPFKCDQCIKAFVREIDYKNHINSHKHIKPFTCEHCGCRFIRKYNYMRHRREHHGQKKFSCDLCGKLFHRHYYLIEHRRTHTGERPYLCTICGKSSTTKTNHNKHLKIHHSRDPFTSEV